MPQPKEAAKNIKKTGKVVHNYFKEFCDNTTINGLKYFTERRSLTEKLWWSVVIGLSFYACVHLIYETYTKWVSSPVIVSFATSQTDIAEVPFPAVTICTDIKSRSEKINYTDLSKKVSKGIELSEEELRQYNYLNLVCDNHPTALNESKKITSTEDALDFLTEIAPTVNDVVESVRWRGNVYKNSSKFFTPVLTSEGVCFTFNLLDRSEIFTKAVIPYKNFFYNGNVSSWSVGKGYLKSTARPYPRFSVVSGTAGGVDLVLTVREEDIDYYCNPDFVGFKISLLHPAQVPRGRKNFFTVPLNQMVLANVKPIILKTAEELRNYSPEKRKCYFGNERTLRFYKIYNQPNCLLECLTNYTLDKCGCVGFHMPRVSSTPICGFSSRKCMESAKALYLMPETDKSGISTSYSEKCHCLATCSALDYEVEISQSEWNWQRIYEVNSTQAPGIFRSRLRIFFKYMQFVTSVRNELYGVTDFLANCGGLLGLFLGFSTVSLFEIIYFLSLRIICNIRMHKKKKGMAKEQIEIQDISSEDNISI